MNPGELKDRIMLQKKAEQTGPISNLDDYKDYKPIWSKADFLRGRNFYAARAANIKTDVEFTIRHRKDIDATMRIMFNEDAYDIEGIIPHHKDKKYLIIKAYNIKHDM